MIIGKQLAESYEDEKLFSTGDEELDAILEEVYYSGIEDGYDYAQKEFASKVWDIEDEEDDEEEKNRKAERREKRKGKSLGESHRGLGRSYFLGGGLPGAIGAYTTKSQAEEDYKKGYSESDIVSRASKRGMKRGAILGGGLGVARGIASGQPLVAIPAAAIGAGFGALGGSLGAKKNAKTRLENRKEREED